MDLNSHFLISTRAFKLSTRAFKLLTRNSQLITLNSCLTISHKIEYVTHIRNLKQALNHELVLKKVHRVNQSNHNASLKLYVNMNKE